ncbi:Holliday junction resolvase RecU [Acetobacterium wieringae]|uniref:Holliday junction resolvase RecU n=1 Tax=Acetobacterium wieringae TaxID=52694 RepID=A0A1F2PDE7_9FIRM|nr:Holliday junction resolvase RecU [Acetobacterium wieringae]OFV69273.1 holliday junction resolvase RecU [Acetobacterium wieringae]
MTKTIYNEEKYVEKYPDPTAAQAIENINRENRKSREQLQGHRSRVIGKSFEEVIEAACINYRNKEIAIIEKTPEPMKVLGKVHRRGSNGRFEACFIKKAQPDFKGCLANGKAIVFEAKATEKDRIRKNVITDEQFEYLEGYWKMKASAFVLVCFNMERYYRVPWGIWREMEVIFGRKYLQERDLESCRVMFWNGYLDFMHNIAEV